MLRPAMGSGGMPRPASAQRVDARAAGMQRSGMHRTAEVNPAAPAASAAADMADCPVAAASPSPASASAPATRLGRFGKENGNDRDRQQGRDRDDKPPEHGRLPRLHLPHPPPVQVNNEP